MQFANYALTAAAAYLLGSIPTGYLVACVRGVDIRSLGSGNIGATNVFRFLGKKAGVTVLLVDALKGFMAARFISFGVDPATMEVHEIIAGIAAIFGHNYTCWLRFKGGKGIATTAGVLMGWFPIVCAGEVGLWLLVFAATRYVSLASVVVALALPFVIRFTGASQTMIGIGAILGALATYKHRANIRRLFAGTEHRFTRKKPEAGPQTTA